MMTWIQRGGPVVWPLLLLSLLATTVVIDRIRFWMRTGRQHDELLELARREGLEAVERLIARGMVLLDTVITIAPMLGILGTVTGIIQSFELLGGEARPDPLGVSSGIAEALITTALGLVVALCTILPYNWLRARIRTVLFDLELALQREEAP
ncbi:MAG: MotA/TolQ/ExbB proton channel family protein [Planctomycetes bacterium]|nr:MotA/TolQ/ExbB proton channel family protein [Planctomycetota bacterium]MCB9909073.1 MotA/TolQ/ExbB proton channel family protein [Planctomycetota bacterium]MCB9911680.1 MotA/TolQ/ExbB proton channel family protein [Planctomycetota bacterium]HPF13377.1 MotA/TolQ/ExbB proton channel family protein [Planctomycetota bacterium]HRV80976.1 MotA/TolQ/ExbB proton channel family protein [Planctomycetota bacterium]